MLLALKRVKISSTLISNLSYITLLLQLPQLPHFFDESEFEKEDTLAQVISESESEERSKNQDLKKLGPDKLNKKDTNEPDIKKELPKALIKPSQKPSNIKPVIQQSLTAFFTLKAQIEAPLPLIEKEEEDIFEDIDSSDDKDLEFDALRKAEFKAEDNSIKLDDLNDVKFINSSRSELLLDSLISNVITLNLPFSTPKTYKKVLTSVKQQINNKHLLLLPRVRFEYSLIQQYVQNLLKKEPRKGRIEASLPVAESNHPTGNGKTLARKIRALYLYYRTYGFLPLETRGGK
ncbi:hypothetical protein DL98DRAFT_620556 [Cadophora sp. DSE1049]|nr:hypothetical protein DL98DRAFT_620556 [Cadophora sp. DSE1049]